MSFDQFCKIEFGGNFNSTQIFAVVYLVEEMLSHTSLVKSISLVYLQNYVLVNRITIVEVFEFKLYCKGHTKSFAYFEQVKKVVFMKRIETSMYNPSMILVLNNVLNDDNVVLEFVCVQKQIWPLFSLFSARSIDIEPVFDFFTARADPGGTQGPGNPLTLGFEASKLSIFGPYLIFP